MEKVEVFPSEKGACVTQPCFRGIAHGVLTAEQGTQGEKRLFWRAGAVSPHSRNNQICCILVLIQAMNEEEVPWKHCLMDIVGWIQIPAQKFREERRVWQEGTVRSRGAAQFRVTLSHLPPVPELLLPRRTESCASSAHLTWHTWYSLPAPWEQSFILYCLPAPRLLLTLALGKEEPWPFVKPTVQALGLKHSRLLHPSPLFPNVFFQLCVCWQKMDH